MTVFGSANDLINALSDGAITSLDQFTIKRTGGSNGNPQTRTNHKEWRSAGAAQTTTVGGQWHSLWTNEGTMCHGAQPTTWANPDNTTPGGWMQSNAGGGRSLYLAALIGAISGGPGTLMIYDRLGHMSGMTGTAAGTQNVNGGSPGAITRYTNGIGNFAAVEIYSNPGNTVNQTQFSYTDESTTLRTSDAMTLGAAGRQEAGRLCMMSHFLGSYGVQSVTSIITNSGNAGTGNYGVTIGHPLFHLTIGAGGYGSVTSFVNGPIAKVLANACLAMAYMPSQSSAAPNPQADLFMELVEA